MATEIERKFLVKDDGWRGAAESSRHIVQAYVALDSAVSLRVRVIDGRWGNLTVKLGISVLSREEFEYPVPLEDARQLVAASGTRIIEKTRHAIPVEGFMWEVDVYEGTLDGLVIAEVELTSEEDDPVLPPWVGAEVTGDKRWSNQVLAVGGMPEDALRRAESQQA